MFLVLTLVCRNEEDILASTARFHLEHGVDHLIITDNGSEDGTVGILRELEATGRVTLLFEPEHNHDQAIWVTRMARLAAEKFGADWVINCDADEFFWAKSGDLKKELAAAPSDVHALSISRTNFLPPPEGSPCENPFYHSQLIRERDSKNALGKPLPPKVCHRGHPEIGVMDGNHEVRLAGAPISAPFAQDIEILHYPVRSYGQLERKVREGAQALNRNNRIHRGIGNNWRYLYEEYWQKGRLAEYYRELQLTAEARARLLQSGELLFDDRLMQALSSDD